MKKVLTLIIVISFLSCSKDIEFEKTTGTKLISIEYDDNNDNWIENYTYSSNEDLVKIEDFRSLGRKYEIDYHNTKLNEYKTYRMDEDKLVFRDSIIYNSNGTIQAIYNFSINSDEEIPLTWIYEFEYDNENKVSRKSTFFVSTQKYTSIEKYYWKGNNIEKVEYYNENEELYYEFFYVYDNKINFKKEIPTGISNPINWSENNVIKMNWNDYYGNLDIICRPCITEYIYNLDNYPISIKFNWGKEMKLKYE